MVLRNQFNVLFFLISLMTVYPSFSKPPLEKPLLEEQKSEKVIRVVKVNLNEAEAKKIAKKVKGIGIKRAEAIVKYRETHGPFKDLKSLSEVKGISKRFVTLHWSEIESEFSIE